MPACIRCGAEDGGTLGCWKGTCPPVQKTAPDAPQGPQASPPDPARPAGDPPPPATQEGA